MDAPVVRFPGVESFELYSTMKSATSGTSIPLLLHLKTEDQKKDDVHPSDVWLVLDVSGSMRSVTTELRNLASTVAEGVATIPGSRLEITVFSNNVQTIFDSELVPDDVAEKQLFLSKAHRVINRIRATGATNTHAAVRHVLDGVGLGRIVIFVTDGDPSTGTITDPNKIIEDVKVCDDETPRSGWQLLVIGLGHGLRDESTAALGQAMLSGSDYKIVETINDIPSLIGMSLGDRGLASHLTLSLMGSSQSMLVHEPKLPPILKYNQDLWFMLEVKGPGPVCCLLTGVVDGKDVMAQANIHIPQTDTVVANPDKDLDWKWASLKVGSLLTRCRDDNTTGDGKLLQEAEALLEPFNSPRAKTLKNQVRDMKTATSRRDRYLLTQKADSLLRSSSEAARRTASNYTDKYQAATRATTTPRCDPSLSLRSKNTTQSATPSSLRSATPSSISTSPRPPAAPPPSPVDSSDQGGNHVLLATRYKDVSVLLQALNANQVSLAFFPGVFFLFLKTWPCILWIVRKAKLDPMCVKWFYFPAINSRVCTAGSMMMLPVCALTRTPVANGVRQFWISTQVPPFVWLGFEEKTKLANGLWIFRCLCSPALNSLVVAFLMAPSVGFAGDTVGF